MVQYWLPLQALGHASVPSSPLRLSQLPASGLFPTWQLEFQRPLSLRRIDLHEGALKKREGVSTESFYAMDERGIAHKLESRDHLTESMNPVISWDIVPDLKVRALILVSSSPEATVDLSRLDVLGDLLELPRHSQLAQDLWVVAMFKGMQRGGFVEFGSTNGTSLNNTILLEQLFNWQGVCVEPNPAYFKELVTRRSAVCIPKAAMHGEPRQVDFVPSGVYGTVSRFVTSDGHANKRLATLAEQGTITVETVRPDDVMATAGRREVGYVSLDTEGSEFEILRSIDLDRFSVALFTIEHNFISEKRKAIYDHLTARHYARMSAQFDDWYYSRLILEEHMGIPATHVDDVLTFFSERFGYNRS